MSLPGSTNGDRRGVPVCLRTFPCADGALVSFADSSLHWQRETAQPEHVALWPGGAREFVHTSSGYVEAAEQKRLAQQRPGT
eukprot:909929-Rhodomonas_salina.1